MVKTTDAAPPWAAPHPENVTQVCRLIRGCSVADPDPTRGGPPPAGTRAVAPPPAMPEAATPGTTDDPAAATATGPTTTAAGASSATAPSAAAASATAAATSRQRGRSGPAQHQARYAESRDEIDSEQSGYRQATRNKFSHPVPGHFPSIYAKPETKKAYPRRSHEASERLFSLAISTPIRAGPSALRSRLDRQNGAFS